MKKLKFCLVGVGSIGRRHLRLLKERKDVQMSVVEPSDASWEAAAAIASESPRYCSLEEALKTEKPDAVLIATPHGMHAGMALQALEAGVHVFCEKPMSDSMEECVAMLEAAKKSGKVFSVGFMFHFDPFVQKVKEVSDSGQIGTVLHYASRFATYNTLLCSVSGHQEHMPYSLVMDCIHDTDLLCWITGRVPDYAFTNAIKAGNMERSSVPNLLDTVYRWEKGDFAANIHFDYVQHPQVHTVEIVGDRGYIQGDFMSGTIVVGKIDGSKETLIIQRNFDDVYRAEWEHFVQAVRGEKAPENPPQEAIYSTLLMQAQKESGMGGVEVDIREIAGRYGFEKED